MKVTNIKRIIKEQMPTDVQKWIDQLLFPLNNAISQFTYALTNQLTITDNFLGSIRTIQISGSSVLTGDTSAGSSTIANASYSQYNPIGSVNQYGIQKGAAVVGVGIPASAVITNISGTNVTISQNANATQIGGKFQVGGSYPITFTHNLAVKPQIMWIVSAAEVASSPVILTEGLFPDWYTNGADIIVRNISGLEAGRTYNITFAILGA